MQSEQVTIKITAYADDSTLRSFYPCQGTKHTGPGYEYFGRDNPFKAENTQPLSKLAQQLENVPGVSAGFIHRDKVCVAIDASRNWNEITPEIVDVMVKNLYSREIYTNWRNRLTTPNLMYNYRDTPINAALID